jgi:hypothetical protein
MTRHSSSSAMRTAYIVALRGWQLQDRELEVQPV